MVGFDYDPDRDSMIRLLPPNNVIFDFNIQKMRYSGERPQDEYETGGADTRRSPADAPFRYGADGPSLRAAPRRSGRLPSWSSAYCACYGARAALVERPKSRGRSRAGLLPVSKRREAPATSARLLRADPAGDGSDDDERGAHPEHRAGCGCQDDRGGDG